MNDELTEDLVAEDFVDEDEFEEAAEDDFVDDEEMEDLLGALESYDDEAAEFLGLIPGVPSPSRLLGSLFGGRGRRPPGRLRAVPKQIGRLPSMPGVKSSSFQAALRGFATKIEVKRTAAVLDRKIAGLSRRTSTLDRRVRSNNGRINTTQKRLSQEVNKLRAVDAGHRRGIVALRKRDSQLAQEVNGVRQTSLILSLLGGGEKTFEVTDIQQETVLVPQIDESTGTTSFQPQQQLSEIQLKPKGDSFDDLLPLVLLGGLGGTAGQTKGGLDPMLMLLLLKD